MSFNWKGRLERMTTDSSTSAELTGGAGYTYEDTVVAYYLAALLREEGAPGQRGVVTRVAVQQAPAYPLDDLVVEFASPGIHRTLSVQVKRALTISGAASNVDFGTILRSAAATLATHEFKPGADKYGFIVEHVAARRWRDFCRLIELADSNPDGASFGRHFRSTGSTSKAVRELRGQLSPLIEATSLDEERRFYSHFVALKLEGLQGRGLLGTELANRLRELVAAKGGAATADVLRDSLCTIAREGAGTGRTWTRESLLRQLRDRGVALKVAPSYESDMDRIEAFSRAALADISDEIAGVRIDRPTVEKAVREQTARYRLVNLSGLPGCGKSAVLKRMAATLAPDGLLLFLKYDRIEGRSWAAFAEALGLEHGDAGQVLAEIGSCGAPTLFIDGIDRIDPERKGVVIDILRAIEGSEHLDHWSVLASSRNQGLEGYRTWFPASFYDATGIGDVPIPAFDDDEAAQLAKAEPALSPLLFGPPNVAEIARRPFFAGVLAQSSRTREAPPQTEIDLIAAWWRGGGYDVPEVVTAQRQRALLDIAQQGMCTLGRKIPARKLSDGTLSQIPTLKADQLLIADEDGAWYSFAHDVFFEWVFYRRLVELEEDWPDELARAGEPPLLGRVVGLLAQNALRRPGGWAAGYRSLEEKRLRPQWRREWLTAPPFTSAFAGRETEFDQFLAEDDNRLLGNFLLWFQAHHTVPNPLILAGHAVTGDSRDQIQLADYFGWPSDVAGWSRLLYWLIPKAPALRRRFAPAVAQLFSVWQNAFANAANPRSAAILDVCSDWLVELEEVDCAPLDQSIDYRGWADLGAPARTGLATDLRLMIGRSAAAYPEKTRDLFRRAVEHRRMRETAYAELMALSPLAADVCPDTLADVAKAELIEELPEDRVARRRREQNASFARLREIRETPEDQRSAREQRLLQHAPMPIRVERIDPDDIGIKRFQTYYHPPSALHEPFGTLFRKAPDTAIAMVRELANHAVEGWRQNGRLRERDSPIPVTLRFPWGDQVFWGDDNHYEWFTIGASPEPLDCALLALRHWAFKEIERGRAVDEVLRAVIEGNTCYGVLGLALGLAIESLHVSETVLPIVTCQRLWHDDLRRFVQESTRDIDLLGFGPQSALHGDKAAAKEFLDTRQYRKREIRDLGTCFAISGDSVLRGRFEELLARFPASLPCTTEAQRDDPRVTDFLRQQAERWAELGDVRNYHLVKQDGQPTQIAFESPTPRTEDEQRRLKENAAYFEENRVIAWATRCLQTGTVVDGVLMADAIRIAKRRDHAAMFGERRDAGDHSPQTVVSAVAAAALCSDGLSRPDHEWAWDVMARVQAMREPPRALPGSKIPWHPAGHLVAILAHDRRADRPRPDSVSRLLRLALHAVEDVVKASFAVLLSDPDTHVRWVAGELALNLSIRPRPGVGDDAAAARAAAATAKQRAVEDALGSLKQPARPWADLPAPWTKVPRRLAFGARPGGWEEWGDPDPFFDAGAAAKLLPMFPIETWCRSPVHMPLVLKGMGQLVAWTAERLVPAWNLAAGRDDAARSAATYLLEWNRALAQIVARSAPFLELDLVRGEHLDPFVVDNEDSFSVVAEFIADTVVRQVIDAPAVPDNTLAMLDDCVDRVLRHPALRRGGYRAGELHGWSLPKAVRALLFIPLDEAAPGAARFANGDWTDIGIAMPIVSRLVTELAWSRDVMQYFLELCERAGDAYPIDAFADQVATAAGYVDKQWSGTTIPARLAAAIQRLADANYPIDGELAHRLLLVLDALVELGDRRSVALEQSPAFRGIQCA